MRKIITVLMTLCLALTLFACNVKPDKNTQIETLATFETTGTYQGKNELFDKYKAHYISKKFKENEIKFQKDNKPSAELVGKVGTYITKVKEKENKVVIYYYKNLYNTFSYLENFSLRDIIDAKNNNDDYYELAKYIDTDNFQYVINNDKEMGTFAKIHDSEGKEVNIHEFKILDETLSDDNTNPLKDKKFTVYLYSNDFAYEKNLLENATQKQLYISKFLISKNENDKKLIELYNPTNDTINLEEYAIRLRNKNGKVEHTFKLSGNLEAGKVYQIFNAKYEGCDLSIPRLSTLNGETVIELCAKNMTALDIIGNPYSTSQGFSRNDELFIRRQKRTKLYDVKDQTDSLVDINHGTRVFNFDDWAGYIPTFEEPIKAKQHPYDTATKYPFPTELKNTSFLNGGLTQCTHRKIHDGDTAEFVSLDGSEKYVGDSRVRYYIVDTPETEKPGHSGEPYAQVAKEYNTNRLKNAKEIYIMSHLYGTHFKGGYGRYMGLVWVVNHDGSYECINLELIKNGLIKERLEGSARASEYQKENVLGNRYLYQWEREAFNYGQAHKVGIFSGNKSIK